MGEVYLAKTGGVHGFEKFCVVKKILPHLSQDPEFVLRFINEANTVVRLTHGNIVQVFDMGVVNEDYYIAMEYVEGEDLRAILERCCYLSVKIPIPICLYIIKELLSGLSYAHRKTDERGQALNLVHRDISPHNILVAFEGEVKIADFGLAKSTMASFRTNPQVRFGKLAYMSPEQCLGRPVDRRTDIYSAGVVLYELIVCDKLFADVDQIRLMESVVQNRIPPLSRRAPHVTPEVEELVMRALHGDPAERYQESEEFQEQVSVCLRAHSSTGASDLTRFVESIFQDRIARRRRSYGEWTRLWRDDGDSSCRSLVPQKFFIEFHTPADRNGKRPKESERGSFAQAERTTSKQLGGRDEDKTSLIAIHVPTMMFSAQESVQALGAEDHTVVVRPQEATVSRAGGSIAIAIAFLASTLLVCLSLYFLGERRLVNGISPLGAMVTPPLDGGVESKPQDAMLSEREWWDGGGKLTILLPDYGASPPQADLIVTPSGEALVNDGQ